MNIPDTPEAALRTLALQNRGTQNFFQKAQLAELVQQRGLEVPEKASKAELYDLLASACPLEELEELGGMGLPSLNWQTRFDITGPQVRKMARLGLMRRTGTERFRRFGRYLNAPLYSVVDFYRLTKEDVTRALEGTKCAKSL